MAALLLSRKKRGTEENRQPEITKRYVRRYGMNGKRTLKNGIVGISALILFFLLFSGTAFADGPAGVDALHVEDGLLADADGQTVQLRGVSTHGLTWYPGFVSEDRFRQLTDDWDANLIRLAMYSENYCGGEREASEALMKNARFELYKDKHSFVIGGMENMRYKEYELQLNKGDKLFLYTDGVPEATDAENELFGTARMIDALNACADRSPEALLACVKSAVDVFVGEAEQFDDLTMLCLEYKGVFPN